MTEKQRKFMVIEVEIDERKLYQVVDKKDLFRRAESGSPRGAVAGALACGVPLHEIDFNDFRVGRF